MPPSRTTTQRGQPVSDSLVAQVEAFIAEQVIPLEVEHRGNLHHASEQFRQLLQAGARERGLLAPHVSKEWGGHGLGLVDRAPVFEAAGYSLFGPLALNIAAPDEGNMHLLEEVATEAQKQKYLAPLAAGEVRSAFAMTEPAPGAGSDPSMLRTRAEKVDGGWKIDGHKWFITGATGASFFICMARTGDGASGDGATMFLVDADNPGVRVQRSIDTLDEAMIGGHGEVFFEHCVVSDDDVLGEVNAGFRYAQVRLGPARLTHCMRWLGIAIRSHHMALDRAIDREAFGARLGDLGMIQQMIADNEIDIAATRAITKMASEVIDGGGKGSAETSMAKTFSAEAICRVVDRSLQICGSLGVSRDILLSQYYQEVRPFRIYDGPSETHRWSIAKRAVRAAESRRHR